MGSMTYSFEQAVEKFRELLKEHSKQDVQRALDGQSVIPVEHHATVIQIRGDLGAERAESALEKAARSEDDLIRGNDESDLSGFGIAPEGDPFRRAVGRIIVEQDIDRATERDMYFPDNIMSTTAQDLARRQHSLRHHHPIEYLIAVRNDGNEKAGARQALRRMESGRFEPVLDKNHRMFRALDLDEMRAWSSKNPELLRWTAVWGFLEDLSYFRQVLEDVDSRLLDAIQIIQDGIHGG